MTTTTIRRSLTGLLIAAVATLASCGNLGPPEPDATPSDAAETACAAVDQALDIAERDGHAGSPEVASLVDEALAAALRSDDPVLLYYTYDLRSALESGNPDLLLTVLGNTATGCAQAGL